MIHKKIIVKAYPHQNNNHIVCSSCLQPMLCIGRLYMQICRICHNCLSYFDKVVERLDLLKFYMMCINTFEFLLDNVFVTFSTNYQHCVPIFLPICFFVQLNWSFFNVLGKTTRLESQEFQFHISLYDVLSMILTIINFEYGYRPLIYQNETLKRLLTKFSPRQFQTFDNSCHL